MRSIVTATFVRNAEKYIVPHMKMYKGLTNYVFSMNQKPANWRWYSEEPDKAIEIVKERFPESIIKNIDSSEYDGNLINRALDQIDADVMIFFHADVVFSDSDFSKFLNFIQETDYDLYRLDMKRCMIDYYYDFDHGVRDCQDCDPVAISRRVRFNSKYWADLIPTPNKTYTVDWKGFTAHHFNGWKGMFATKEWVDGKVSDFDHAPAAALERDFGGWLSCPKEIREKFL